MFADQVGQHFGVRDRMEVVSFHSLFQAFVILDHAVVHNRDLPALIIVRMRVFVGGRPMRCPAGVS